MSREPRETGFSRITDHGSRITAVLACALVAAVATGCGTGTGAPVFDRTREAKPAPAKPAGTVSAAPRPGDTRPEFHVVAKGDTLYSIALDNGLDYRELAQWNGVSDPGVIRIGQQLRLKSPDTAAAAPLKTAPGLEGRPLGEGPAAAAGAKTQPKSATKPDPRAAAASEDGIQWAWPVSGKVVNTFNGTTVKGIGIAGKPGQPVLASAPGRIIFSGTATGTLGRLGKLIVIKHNETFVSVYAYNRELLVKEGQNVARGQRIAEMGAADADQVKLHFEIRQFGKPMDPIKLLPPA